MKNVAALISNSGDLTIVCDGKVYSISTDHVNYKAIVKALKTKTYDILATLLDIGKTITIKSEGKVTIADGSVMYDGKVIHNTLTQRILNLMRDEYPFEPMVKFLENLMLNPSARAVNELYGFLEIAELPITEDGYFLAYKRINDDYTDCHTGTVDNHIGQSPTMPRNMVDDDKDRTCSTGFHFCSRNYLSAFHSGEGHIMIVKINPKDVVSIPSDHNNTKGRCCTYTVIDEYVVDEKNSPIKEKFDKPLYSACGQEVEVEDVDDNESCEICGKYNCDGFCDEREKTFNNSYCTNEVLGVKPNGDKFWNLRDSKGHFTKRR